MKASPLQKIATDRASHVTWFERRYGVTRYRADEAFQAASEVATRSERDCIAGRSYRETRVWFRNRMWMIDSDSQQSAFVKKTVPLSESPIVERQETVQRECDPFTDRVEEELDTKHLVHKILSSLPQSQRAIYECLYLKGMSTKEATAALDMTPDRLKKEHRKLHQRIKQILAGMVFSEQCKRIRALIESTPKENDQLIQSHLIDCKPCKAFFLKRTVPKWIGCWVPLSILVLIYRTGNAKAGGGVLSTLTKTTTGKIISGCVGICVVGGATAAMMTTNQDTPRSQSIPGTTEILKQIPPAPPQVNKDLEKKPVQAKPKKHKPKPAPTPKPEPAAVKTAPVKPPAKPVSPTRTAPPKPVPPPKQSPNGEFSDPIDDWQQ